MSRKLLIPVVCGFGSMCAFGQQAEANKDRAPLYDITVISRTTKAINYGHNSLPTKIDFAGTPLLPFAKGDATVQNKRGTTTIEAHFSGLESPQRFGPEFLTYVLWAISPDGRSQNLGELFLGTREKGKMTASSNLQAFALIVTAEPHFSVSQPSDAVVVENVVRPDTIGKVEEVNATYELLPRKSFVHDKDAAKAPNGAMVSREEYDTLSAIYQAQNAVQIAESQGARQHANDRLTRAQDLLREAQRMSKSQRKQAIATAREAAQVAEDARRIAEKRAGKEIHPQVSSN
jgi:hypothetical protein